MLVYLWSFHWLKESKDKHMCMLWCKLTQVCHSLCVRNSLVIKQHVSWWLFFLPIGTIISCGGVCRKAGVTAVQLILLFVQLNYHHSWTALLSSPHQHHHHWSPSPPPPSDSAPTGARPESELYQAQDRNVPNRTSCSSRILQTQSCFIHTWTRLDITQTLY